MKRRSLRNDQFSREVMKKCIAYSYSLNARYKGKISKRRVYKEVLEALDSFGCPIKSLQKELKKEVLELCEAGRVAYKYQHNIEVWYDKFNLIEKKRGWQVKVEL